MEWTEGLLFLHSFYYRASWMASHCQDDKAPSQVQVHVISQQACEDCCHEEDAKAIAKPSNTCLRYHRDRKWHTPHIRAKFLSVVFEPQTCLFSKGR